MIITDKLSDVRVLCLGDVMLDRFVSGQVKRISPESPVPVLSIVATRSVPGGAANVARNVAALGGQCTLLGVIGEDAVGRELQHSIDGISGVEACLSICAERPTSEKVRFVANGQHMLRADTESATWIDPSTASALIAKVRQIAPEHDVIVLSDYAKGVLTESVIRGVVDVARHFGLPLIVDPKSIDLSRYAGATLITPNSKEVMDATGIDPTEDAAAERAGQLILQQASVGMVLLTRAQRGMTLIAANQTALHIPAAAKEVFDVVGAGDTVIATLSLALGARLPLADAARLANIAAGIVVGKRGTATVTRVELADELARANSGSLRSLEDKIISRTQAIELARTWRKHGFQVGFTNGCFDILHVGHLSILTFSKQHCGKLIVAVNSDASVKRLKEAGRPVNPEHDRAMVLAALAAVDAVVVFDEDTPLELIKELGPDVLVKGADYTLEGIVGAEHVISQGGKVLRCPLVPDRSTSRVVNTLRASVVS